MLQKLIVGFFILFGWFTLYAQPITKNSLRKIAISDCWYGLGTPAEKYYEIDVAGSYQLKDTTGKVLGIIKQGTIDSLIEVLNDTAYIDLTLTAFGYTSSLLLKKAPEIAQKYNSYNALSIKAQQLLVSQLLDSIKVAAAIINLYKFHWTDDYPKVIVSFIYPNSDTIEVFTFAQQPIMLPWQGCNILSYNPNVSSLIRSILPYQNVNSRRLSIDALEEKIAQSVYYKYVQKVR